MTNQIHFCYRKVYLPALKNRVVISSGSNEGNRLDHLIKAREYLRENLGDLLMESAVYESKSWGFEGADFLNQVWVFDSPLDPDQCLQVLLGYEKLVGRIRHDKKNYSDRPIDLDLLFYNDLVLDSPGLVVPHPRMTDRLFVMLPLTELMPDWIHPELGDSMSELLLRCEDKTKIKKLE